MEFGIQFFPAVGPDQKPADQYWREALELDPSDATAVYNLGVVAQDEGNDDEESHTEADVVLEAP